jgi:hypothetical protein
MWNTDVLGYSPDSPLYEVPCHAGAICDPGGWWSYTTQDLESSLYVVTFVSEGRGRDRPPRPESF